MAEIQKAITLNPSGWPLYLELAMLQLRTNQPDAAETSFKKVIEIHPAATQAHLLLGTFYQSRSRFAEAEQQFQAAMDMDSRDPEARAALARLYLAEGKNAAAEELLKQVKRDFPDNSTGYRMLGDFYFSTGDLGKATAEYGALYWQHPKDLDVKKNYVQLLILNHSYDQARKLDEEILKASPNDNDALLYRGQLEVQAGNANGAIATLQTVVKNDPNNAAAHYQLGVAFQKLGNLENTESEWRDAVRLRPDMIEAQRSLALLAMRQGDMGTLEQAANRLISLQPASPDGYALRALSEINRKQLQAAEDDISKAIAVDPQSHLAYVQLGNLKLTQKQYSDAGKAYQQALDRDPNSTDALRGLMNTYLVQNQVERALAIANAQIAKVPANSSFYDLLGTALFHNRKDLGAAEAAFKKSIELDKNNVDVLLKLGQVQAAKGEVDQAIVTYQQAIKDHSRVSQFYTLLGALYESRGTGAKLRRHIRKPWNSPLMILWPPTTLPMSCCKVVVMSIWRCR
jgi:tetratricopeptide (TPR) repeat protein